MPSPRRTFRHATLLLVLLAGLTACQGPPANRPPVAALAAAPRSGPAPLTVGFDGSGSLVAHGRIVGYAWDFGDGRGASGATATHTYVTPGSFVARLTVTDDRGATGQDDVLIVVSGPTGSVSGSITVGGGAAAAGDGAAAAVGEPEAGSPPGPAPPVTAGALPDLVPGELIVKFRPGVVAPASLPSAAVGAIEAVRPLAIPGAQLYRRSGLSPTATLALARELARRPDVLYAEPNYLLRTLAPPNDPFFPLQWHYPAIELPAAWEVTTGSPGIVVAVVDTGILHAAATPSLTHPDLVGRVLPGYDFISNPQVAGDGDGRDPDPYDVGDVPGGTSSYHGSHVAGTIAAATDNGTGVAGVDWQAKILPVRALGIGGGSLLDVVEGTLWAAGFAVAGVPANPDPAHVINLSLGGAYTCTEFEQEAYDRIALESPRHAIVVVAAGNADANAAGFSPASCRNVITVGATEVRGFRSYYSNYGPRIDVMAPGGDLTANRNGDAYPDGVLSTSKNDTTGNFSYFFLQGTSMASPHVAGVVSLLKSLDPTLTPGDALALLQATARPLSAAACLRPTADDCGAGLIDAAAAVTALSTGTGAALAFSPPVLDFGGDLGVVELTLTNTGTVPLTWSMADFVPRPDNPGDMLPGSTFLPSGAPGAGVLAVGAAAATSFGLDRDRVTGDGSYQGTLAFDVEGPGLPLGERPLTVRFRIDAEAATPQGPMIVAAFLDDGAGGLAESGYQADPGFMASYAFAVLPGPNLLIAWSDENDDLEINDGDYIGVHPALVPVAAGQSVAGVDIVLERVVSVDGWRDGLAADGGWRDALAPDGTARRTLEARLGDLR